MKRGKENSFDDNADANLNPSNSTPVSAEKRCKKAKREGLKEISNGDKVGGDCSIESSPKGPKGSMKKSEKKMKTTGKDDSVPVKKKSSKKRVLDGLSFHPFRPEDERNKNDGGKGQDKLSEKKMKTTVEDGCVTLEKKSSKKRVSGEVSFHPIKPEDERNKNDSGKNQDKMSENKMKTSGRDDGEPVGKKISKKRVSDEVSLHPVEQEGERNLNYGGNGQDKMLEKKMKIGKAKKGVLDEVSLHPIIPDDDRKKNDGEKGQDGVLNASKDVNVKAKKRKTKALDLSCEIKKCAINLEQTEVDVVDVPLPQGTILTTVWGIELSPEDTGNALQFLEFCASFGKVTLVNLVESWTKCCSI